MWLATCARKPKVPGWSLAVTYVQRWALCSDHPTNVWVPVKRVERLWGSKEMPSLFTCSPVIREWLRKKTRDRKKIWGGSHSLKNHWEKSIQSYLSLRLVGAVAVDHRMNHQVAVVVEVQRQQQQYLMVLGIIRRDRVEGAVIVPYRYL